jgi:hypothetical protein
LTSRRGVWEFRRVNNKRARATSTGLALALAAIAIAPAAAQASAPTCNDMNVGVPHNAATPIFIDCTGGSGAGSPDVEITADPARGTLDFATGERSTVGDLHADAG